jgi:peptide/nickel transport system substrate-binding protein
LGAKISAGGNLTIRETLAMAGLTGGVKASQAWGERTSLSAQCNHIKGGKKKMRIPKKIGILIALLGMGVGVGFMPTPGAGQTPAPPMERAKTLIVAVAGDLEGWDPATVTYYTANDMMQTLYDRLVEYEVVRTADGRILADPSKIKGMIAEKFSVSKDGLTWTFQLRKGVKFSSGNELTSADVKYSFDRALKMNKGILLSMLKFVGIDSATKMMADEPYVFKVKLSKPNPVLPHIFAQAANSVVLDAKVVGANATKDDPFAEKWLRNHAAGSGPYMLEKYEPGNQVVYTANKKYWKGAPKLEKVIYKTVPSGPDRVMLLMGGAIDIAYDLTPLDLTTTLKGARGVKIASFPTTSTTVFFGNNKLAPFDNVKVRQALCYAMPYDALISKVLYGLGKPATSPIAEGVLYHKAVSSCKYDPERAKSLLAEAGLSKGFNMTLTFREGRSEEEASAVFIQAELAKYNINVALEKIHTAAWAERRAAKTIAAGLDGYTPYVPDPNYALEFWYKTGGVLNTWQYSSPRVDELALRGVVELDPVKRKALIEETQEVVAKDQPVVWLFQPYWNMAMGDNVEGYVFYPDRMTRHFALSKK